MNSNCCYQLQNTLHCCVHSLKGRKRQQPLTSTYTGISHTGHRGVPQVRSYHLLLFFLLISNWQIQPIPVLCYCVQAPVCSQGRLATLLVKYHATHAALCLSPSSLVGMQSEPGGAMERQKKRFKTTGRETAQKEQFLHFQLLLLTLLPLHVQLGGEPVMCQTYFFCQFTWARTEGKAILIAEKLLKFHLA